MTTSPDGLTLQLLLESERVAAGRALARHALLRLQAQGRPDLERPPLDLVACIDASGSMAGEKLEEVKRSLRALANELSEQDRLGVTAFSTEVWQVCAPAKMDANGKARLREAVDRLRPLESTNMSGGVVGACADLGAVPPRPEEAVRRVLLFTDGHANHGIPEQDREGWAALLRTRLGGVSVSWFGFGEDHDADFLAFLADLSRGNAFVARDTDAITDAFAKELGGLLGVRAMDIVLEVRLTRGTAVLLNDERAEQRGERLVISLDDLACEERKDLVLELAVPALSEGQSLGVQVVARWRDVLSGCAQEAVCEAELRGTREPAREPPREVVEAMALVFAAQAQKQARTFAEQGRLQDAVRALEGAARRLEELGTERAWALAQRLSSSLADFRDLGTYGRNRSKLRSSERAMSKQRASGSELDEHFMSELKRSLVARFKEEPRRGDDSGGPKPPPRRKRP
jgi:Mg-chelatase subunit ChlD